MYNVNNSSSKASVLCTFQDHSIEIFKLMFFRHLACCAGSRTTSTDEMLETENNRMVEDLAAKVSRLKGVGRHCCNTVSL